MVSTPTEVPQKALYLVGFGVLAVSTVAFFRVPLLPSIGRDLSMSAADLSVITTVFATGRLATDIPAGRWADRWSAAPLLGVAALVLAAASGLLAAAGSAWVAFVAAFVLGVASAVANTTGVTFFSESTSAARRGRALAAFSAALLGGQAFGPALGGAFASFGTWRTSQWIAAAMAAVVGAVLFTAGRSVATGSRVRHGDATPLPDTAVADAGAESPTSAASTAGGEAAPAAPTAPSDPRSSSWERWILYSVPFAMFFTLGAMPQTLVPIIGASSLGLSAATIGLALGIGGGCRLIGALLGGYIADHISRKAALVPGLAAQALGVALLVFDGVVWIWVAAIVIMSLASFGISVAATMLADLHAGRRVGRHLGPFRFVGDVGLIIGPLGAGFLFEHLGQQAAVLAVTAILAACALASGLGLRETRHGRATTADPESIDA